MKLKKLYGIALGLLAVSGTAYAFPWDIDLVDAKFLRGYKWKMMTPAENTISIEQSSPLTAYEFSSKESDQGPVIFRGAVSWGAQFEAPDLDYSNAQNAAIAHYTDIVSKNPAVFANANEETVKAHMIAEGKNMAKTYCQACHVVEPGNERSPVTWSNEYNVGNKPAVSRWPDAHKVLAGDGNATVAYPLDKMMYDIIRNGKGMMPSYGHAMDDHEIWATIAYLRSVSVPK